MRMTPNEADKENAELAAVGKYPRWLIYRPFPFAVPCEVLAMIEAVAAAAAAPRVDDRAAKGAPPPEQGG